MEYFEAPSTIKWHYSVHGEGECLLFLHGWGMDKRIWKQQEKYFSEKYNVLMIDLPGHGKSSFVKTDLETLADDIIQLLDLLEIQECTLIGSSLGGLFSLKLYEKYPGRIKRMIFVGSMPKFVKDEHYPFGLDMAQFNKLEGQLETAYPVIIEIFFRSLFSREDKKTRRYKWIQKFRVVGDVPIKPALVEYLDVLETEDLREVLKAVEVPMQFINGRCDEICTQDTVKYIQKLAPNAQYDWFEKSGHFPFLISPHEFNDVLEKFLDETK